MKRQSQLQKLQELEKMSRNIRDRLCISNRGEVLFHACLSIWPDSDLIVEADGFGGAKLLIVEGNYPTDYLTRREQRFVDEDKACEAAEKLLADRGRRL